MGSPAPAARPHTDGVVAALETAGLAVGRGEAPPDAGWQGEPGRSTFIGYAVLYPTPGRTQGPEQGTLGDPHQSLLYTAQATCVGATQDQAEYVADQVKTTLVGVRVTVTGRSSHPAYLVLERPAERDDDVSPTLHYLVLQIRFRTDTG